MNFLTKWSASWSVQTTHYKVHTREVKLLAGISRECWDLYSLLHLLDTWFHPTHPAYSMGWCWFTRVWRWGRKFECKRWHCNVTECYCSVTVMLLDCCYIVMVQVNKRLNVLYCYTAFSLSLRVIYISRPSHFFLPKSVSSRCPLKLAYWGIFPHPHSSTPTHPHTPSQPLLLLPASSIMLVLSHLLVSTYVAELRSYLGSKVCTDALFQVPTP